MKPQLSTRQAQVVERVACGKLNKEIANDLGISIRTVEEHIQLAAAKIGNRYKPRERLTLWFFGHIEND